MNLNFLSYHKRLSQKHSRNAEGPCSHHLGGYTIHCCSVLRINGHGFVCHSVECANTSAFSFFTSVFDRTAVKTRNVSLSTHGCVLPLCATYAISDETDRDPWQIWYVFCRNTVWHTMSFSISNQLAYFHFTLSRAELDSTFIDVQHDVPHV